MANTISPNMNLIIPGVGSEQGPTYAFDINASLTLIDMHDHSPGLGVQITPAGLNINAALTFANNSATNLQSTVFVNQTSITTLQALYVKTGAESPTTNDLWYNDSNGNAVQITSGGNVNATAASIPGESYAGGTFFWKQGTGSTTPANFDIGSITLRPNTAGTSNGVVLGPPTAISSQYNIQLPILPSVTSFLTIDNAGNITASPALNGALTTTNLSSSAGIVGTQLADHTITLLQLANSLFQWNTQTFNTSGTFTVPANVNQLYVFGYGGGGAGGGGGGRGTTAAAAGGGGGGAASLPFLYPLAVTPGDVISVTIAASATGGGGGASGGGNGANGTDGGDCIFGSLTFPGAQAGRGGTGTTGGGAGGAGGGSSFITWYSNSPGGTGASGSGSGGSGTRSATTAGASGGASALAGGGGGGGSAGYGGASGTGGSGGTSPGAGNSADSNSGGGGGGGAAKGGSVAGSSAVGGNGGEGRIVVYWLGAT